MSRYDINSMDIDRPLLGKKVDLETLKYPVLVTPKIDGIRCLKTGNDAVTRKNVRIPNNEIRETLRAALPDGMDGELQCGDFENTSSVVLSPTNTGNWKYYIFDYVKSSFIRHYENRVEDLAKWYESLDPSLKDRIQILTPQIINNQEDLLEYYEMALSDGYEGLILRSPTGRYKQGRSTVREGFLLKLKPREDMEAKVIGAKSLKNGEYGLGAFIVELPDGQTMSLGMGFTNKQRELFWSKFSLYKGQRVTFKYSGLTNRGIPKQATFKSFRSQMDIVENFPGFWARIGEILGLNRKVSG